MSHVGMELAFQPVPLTSDISTCQKLFLFLSSPVLVRDGFPQLPSGFFYLPIFQNSRPVGKENGVGLSGQVLWE